jgi:hypothetical protein
MAGKIFSHENSLGPEMVNNTLWFFIHYPVRAVTR